VVQEVTIRDVQGDAEEFYRSGRYYCSEAVEASIRKNMEPDMPAEFIAASSGFPLGVGRSKCMCGAVSGAVICLGYFFGRTEPSSESDPKSKKCMRLANELQQSFRNDHDGVLCCHVHTKAWIWQKRSKRNQCMEFTGEMAAKTARILAREFGLTVVDPDHI